MLDPSDLYYFERGAPENNKFFERLGGWPKVTGLTVLDVGCGHGRLCVDIARRGAKRVVGLDTDQKRIDFAKNNILQNYPELKNVVTFHCQELIDYSEELFDIMVSKDALEHILDVTSLLDEMKKRLKSGGKIYIGFGPLYNSYGGDHSGTRAIIPWGHVIFPESFLIRRANMVRSVKISNIYELGLNKLSYDDYKRILCQCGLKINYLKTNVTNNKVMKIFILLRKIKFLKEFFTYNLYCILEQSVKHSMIKN
jgi:SAM-dependent methyltransferase